MAEEQKSEHTEWEKHHSLASPYDRESYPDPKWKPTSSNSQLTDAETELAMNELNNTAFTSKFPRIDKTFQDPMIPMQNIGLLSFTPAKNAKPDEHGIYGFAKLRGNFASTDEAGQRAEYIIRNVDSYHQIYHTYVGRPFPITLRSDYSAVTEEIDIRREAAKTVSNNIKEKKAAERQEIQEIKEREERLLSESKDDTVDPYELYITLRVKKAQLCWTYISHLNKLKEIRGLVLKARSEIDELDIEHPDFKTSYYEKYMKAREEAGIVENEKESQDNFMKYLVEDVALSGIDDGNVIQLSD